ncbi:MAG TPA: hypothetical protein VEB19_15950 [Gemmatimonadaceae bacterium]|nr:hypothetical protein [Gemmatimonadaceae bacterium]
MSRPVPQTPAAELIPTSGEPRFALGWAALVYGIAALLLAYPALAGDFLVWARSDQYIAGYAFRDFAAETLRSGGGFPQWNPYLFGGMPYVAAMHGDIFYPTFLLRMLLPTDVGMTWGFILHLFLAGLFTFGFLRAYGIGFYGSLAGGLAYMLSGPIAGYASPGHDGKLFVSTLFPLALWMIVRGVRDNRPWSWGVLALTIGLGVLSPHPQLLQYMLLAGGAFALFLALGPAADGSKQPRAVVITRLGYALGAVAIGFAIGAIQYAPVLGYIDWSPRSGGAGWEHAVSFSMPPEELFNAFVPQFSGILNDYWGRNNVHLHSEYPGIAVLILAGAGVFASQFRRSFRWFWIGTLVVSLLWTLGGFTPFYKIIYYLVPGTKFFRAPSTMMYVSMFSLAVLTACGTERLITAASSIPRRFVFAWGGALLALAVLLAGGLGPSIAEGFGTADRAHANQPAVLAGVIRSLVFAAAMLGLIFVARRKSIQPRILAFGALLIVGIDLWSISRKYWIFSPPAKELFAADAAMEAMRRDSTPGRVLQIQFGAGWDRLDRAFSGDVMMVHRIRSVAGYHGNELGRYQALAPQPSEFFAGPERTMQELGRIMRPEYWRHLNVRYLYTTLTDTEMNQIVAGLQLPASPQKILGPVTSKTGSTVYLYRTPGENPAAWVATAMVKGPDEQALATVLDPRFDPTRAAILDTGSSITTATLTTAPEPAGVKASVTRYAPGEIDIQLDQPAAQGSALVVSENFYPGWRASVDTQDAPVARANYNLIGVALPAGARSIQLRFRDTRYDVGKTITLLALGLTAAAIVAGVVLARRHPKLVSAA